jgi:hypothetical protein
MKARGYLSKLVLGVFALLAIGMADAQIGGDVLKFKIPFDFSVGKQTFPSGDYSLRQLLPGTMQLRNHTGRVLTNVDTTSLESRAVPASVKLVFNGYGNSYFLAQIWQAGDNRGWQVIKSPAEIEFARKSATREQLALIMPNH